LEEIDVFIAAILMPYVCTALTFMNIT